MCKLFVVEKHDQVLKLWREQQLQSRSVLHLDFHCDLRGLMIDRSAQIAYRIWDRFPDLDEGNFLTHAVLSGIVSSIRWVHDEPGGRKHDLKTVKYKTDLTALPHRLALLMRREKGVPMQYDVIAQSAWSGLLPGELLDIDWDYFASKEYPIDSVEQRVERFFSRDFIHRPESVFVCYSPGYSHPTRQTFRAFIGQLAQRFQAEIVDAGAPVSVGAQPAVAQHNHGLYRAARHVYQRVGMALRKHDIY